MTRLLGALGGRLGGYRLCTISSGFRIAGRLIDLAGGSLSLLSCGLRLARRRLGPRCGLISPLRRVCGPLRRIGLPGRASRHQRKGQCSPG
jgi:hypothetical protein